MDDCLYCFYPIDFRLISSTSSRSMRMRNDMRKAMVSRILFCDRSCVPSRMNLMSSKERSGLPRRLSHSFRQFCSYGSIFFSSLPLRHEVSPHYARTAVYKTSVMTSYDIFEYATKSQLLWRFGEEFGGFLRSGG
jgi:hypothetical protein